MPKEIWSEGRVCGLSAYEVYVKQHLSEDPDTPPATEREWLASSLTNGSSMLLKVPNTDPSLADDGHTMLQIQLPATSRLAAANTIVAQFFDGDVDSSVFVNNWATRITDYGSLIANYAGTGNAPDGEMTSADNLDTNKVPIKTLQDWNTTKKQQLVDYLKIVDGVVLQPGVWSEADQEFQPPQSDFQANLGANSYPTIRLHVRGKITSNPLVLLTGFSIRSVLAGISGTDTTLDTNSPSDGDFLGPAVFPWAAKIVFSVPNSYIGYFATSGYERGLVTPTASTIDPETGQIADPTYKGIKDISVIDMQASKPETFYNPDSYYQDRMERFSDNPHNPRYQYDVTNFSTLGTVPDDGESVLTVYQRNGIYPPALYGTFINATGAHFLNPLDVVAPGTIKMMSDQGRDGLYQYEATFPGTHAISRGADGRLQMIVQTGVGQAYTDKTQYTSFYVADVEQFYVYNYSNTYSDMYTAVDSGTSYSDQVFIAPGISATNNYQDTLEGAGRPTVFKTKVGKQSALTLLLDTQLRDLSESEFNQNVLGMKISSNPSNQNNIGTAPIRLTHGNSDNDLSWAALLNALRNNRAIDILGLRLKSAKETLTYNYSYGPYLEFGPNTNCVDAWIVSGATLYSKTWLSTFSTPTAANASTPLPGFVYRVKTPGDYYDHVYEWHDATTSYQGYSGTPIAAPMRLYISNTAPNITDVPEGSIGIGWGFSS